MGTITRRSIVKGLSAAASLSFGFGRGRSFGQAGRRSRLHALIIGIDGYLGQTSVRTKSGSFATRAIPKLKGCQNDALAIKAAVEPLVATPARVLIVPRDAGDGVRNSVNRNAVRREWQALV